MTGRQSRVQLERFQGQIFHALELRLGLRSGSPRNALIEFRVGKAYIRRSVIRVLFDGMLKIQFGLCNGFGRYLLQIVAPFHEKLVRLGVGNMRGRWNSGATFNPAAIPAASSDWTANKSDALRSYVFDHKRDPSDARSRCAMILIRSPERATLPSRTLATLSNRPTSRMSTLLPLN